MKTVGRYVFLVMVFCLGIFFICFAGEPENTEEAEKETCLHCHGTDSIDCPACFGVGVKMVRCHSCKGSCVCKSCQGKGYNLCRRCKGEGKITRAYIPVGIGTKGLKTRKKVFPCLKCQETGRINCGTCHEGGMCSRCFGLGVIINAKKQCPNCSGTGKAECPYCQGESADIKVTTYREIVDEIKKLTDNLKEATTALRKDKIKRRFVLKWNKDFAGQRIRWEGELQDVGELKTEERIITIISLELSNEQLLSRLWISPHWEDQLLDVSKGDTLVFSVVFPQMELDLDGDCIFITLFPAKWEQIKSSLDSWRKKELHTHIDWLKLMLIVEPKPPYMNRLEESRLYPGVVPVILLGYKKTDERKLRKFSFE